MPKIAFFLHQLAGGGVERMRLNLAGAFAERGVDSTFVVASGDEPVTWPMPPEVSLVDLGASRVGTAIVPLASYLRRARPDGLLVGGWLVAVVAIWARSLARWQGRIVITLNDNLSACLGYMRPPRNMLIRTLVPRAFSAGDSIVAVSLGVADDFAQVTGIDRERITVVYNPTVTPSIELLARAVPDHPWLSTSAPPLVLAVGRLAPQKDYATLLRAFSFVAQRRDVRLMILGEGEQRGELETLSRELGIADFVALPGWVQNPYSYMSRARLFVLSSLHEGLPNVLIEAMAVGTPVVSTDCPSGPREILEGGKWGALVPVADPEKLAKAILAALDVPRNGLAVQERAQAFTVDASADRYLELLLPDAK